MHDPTNHMKLDFLLSRAADETATAEEWRELERLLSADPAARRRYVRMMDLHAELRVRHATNAGVGGVEAVPVRPKAPQGMGWLALRPFTAAAAGIALGMLCTSVVFGFVGQRQGERKTPLAMLQPGFEDVRMPLAKGFPPGPSLWTGDVAKLVPAEHGVTPKEGRHMLRLETTTYGAPVLFPRQYQIIALPPSTAEPREIEVSASFASADPGSSPCYTIRAYAVNEAPDRLGPDWFTRHWFVERDETIASAVTTLDHPPGSTGWQSFGLRIQVPHKARCLVVFFGVKNQAGSPAKLPHYLDAVQVSFIESPTLP